MIAEFDRPVELLHRLRRLERRLNRLHQFLLARLGSAIGADRRNSRDEREDSKVFHCTLREVAQTAGEKRPRFSRVRSSGNGRPIQKAKRA